MTTLEFEVHIPTDYLERVYAGVLGKLIGVYLGRPFEGWTYRRIMKELGPIEYYVHDRLGDPLVVTDDDVAGTFTFVRALEDYGVSPDLRSKDIGKAWLNYIIEERSILWWGGRGNSTEHTAWLNLKKGIPAPESGSIATNGQGMAEQIGAQIFIDGWAMVAPGQPQLAAKLAEQAGKVSHDGESVYAAMLWAAMEAEAFVSADIEHLIDTGLSMIPKDCAIARMIGDVRTWHKHYPDWRDTRQKIEDNYGYDRYPGNCHVMPNHALMIMAVLYAPDDFQKAQMIVNTSGWDTDCNAGNVGCLVGLMHGLEGLEGGPDWRGPLADRMLVSSADGGAAINDAVRMAYYLVNLGRALAGLEPIEPPKNGARFHFSLPGSRQGFRLQEGFSAGSSSHIGNESFEGGRALSLTYNDLGPGQYVAAVTPVFSPPDVLNMRTYELMATPLVYPGQTVRARVVAHESNEGAVSAMIRMRAYNGSNELVDTDGPATELAPGDEMVLEWKLPEIDGQPIAEIGVVLKTVGRKAAGKVFVDYLGWNGSPALSLHRPAESGDFWRRAWVNGVSFFSKHFPASFRISQSEGEGIIAHGTREWTDYDINTELIVHHAQHAGLAVRVQGLKRYYAVRISRQNQLEIVRHRDDESVVLASCKSPLVLDRGIPFRVKVLGKTISACVGDVTLEAIDDSSKALSDGGIGLIINEGALSCDAITILPA